MILSIVSNWLNLLANRELKRLIRRMDIRHSDLRHDLLQIIYSDVKG